VLLCLEVRTFEPVLLDLEFVDALRDLFFEWFLGGAMRSVTFESKGSLCSRSQFFMDLYDISILKARLPGTGSKLGS